MPSPAASQQAIERAIAAAQACGLAVSRVSVSRDGTVTVETSAAPPPAPAPEPPVDTPAADVHALAPRRWGQRR